MRADRLIALLLLLQNRHQVTAAEVALELEVSERTARRDLEALAMSGVPLYSTAGRGGGWQLLGGARTDLTGLSRDEARALFLAASPALDSTPELKAAMRKLTGALPATFRADAEAASAAIKIDSSGWGQIQAKRPRYLDELIDAVVAGKQADLDYRSPRTGTSSRRIHPLGLVTKRGVWYLIAGTDAGQRTFRVGRISGLTVVEEPVVRPVGFDLEAEWEQIVDNYTTRLGDHTVVVNADPRILSALRFQFRGRIDIAPDAASSGNQWVQATVYEYGATPMAAQLAGFGQSIRLVEASTDVRTELARIARELAEVWLD